jgi:hypothetical protein
MLGPAFRTRSPARREAVERIEGWVRERFDLVAETTVSVAQVECRLPGCPPLETVVAIWEPDGKRYHFKVFKPIDSVKQEDLPFAWMKQGLEVQPGWECDCC